MFLELVTATDVLTYEAELGGRWGVHLDVWCLGGEDGGCGGGAIRDDAEMAGLRGFALPGCRSCDLGLGSDLIKLYY